MCRPCAAIRVDNVPGAPGIGIKTASAADQRIRRPRHAAGPRRRDQAGQAPRDPDRLRRPDPPVAPAGPARLRHAPARAARRPGGARSGPGGPGGLPGADGVPHAGAPGRRRQGAGNARPGHRRPPPRRRRRPRRPPPPQPRGHRHQRLRLRPRPGGPRRLDRRAPTTPASSPSTPRPTPCRPPAPASAASRWPSRPGQACYIPLGHENEGEGGLQLRRARRPHPDPGRRGHGAAEAAAGGPGGPQGGPERQVRPGRPGPLRHRGRADRRHHADQPTCWRAACTATAWTSCPAAAPGPRADPVQDRSPGTGKAQKSFKHVELDAGHRYAAEDADVTLRSVEHPQAPAGRTRAWSPSTRPWSGRMPPVLAEMELAGIQVDPDRLRQLSNDVRPAHGRAGGRGPRARRPPLQPGQPQTDRRHPVRRDGPGRRQEDRHRGQWATDAAMLEDLAAQGHDLPRVLLDWRQLSKLKGTYTDALIAAIDPDTDRVHTCYSAGRRHHRPPGLAPTPTCRTSRSAPRAAARSARPSSPSPAMC